MLLVLEVEAKVIMNPKTRIAIVGGGPVGLFLAIKIKRRGFEVDLYEKGDWPIDKVCGQGILPKGKKLLESIGIQFRNEMSQSFEGIEYIDEELKVKGLLNPHAIGVKRKVLSNQLYQIAKESGVNLYPGHKIDGAVFIRRDQKVEITVGQNTIKYDFLFACDGINSTIRKVLNLDQVREKNLRFGARFHADIAPSSKFVQVYWKDSAEAYITPISQTQVEVAFLWYDQKTFKKSNLYGQLKNMFPELKKYFDCSLGDFKGHGPFKKYSKKLKHHNVFFVGDAYFFLDGITGEGLSIGIRSADILAVHFESFTWRHRFKVWFIYRKYSLLTHFALFMSRHPKVRKKVMNLLSRQKGLFDKLLIVNDI